MADYGSRITSSIYVRGIGARMDQPSVGLNVDNVPYMNKDAYDFDLADISSIEMLRGPQSTLYGRNTMAGVINVTTLSPMRYQGWRVMLEGSSRRRLKGTLGWYHKFSDNIGFRLPDQPLQPKESSRTNTMGNIWIGRGISACGVNCNGGFLLSGTFRTPFPPDICIKEDIPTNIRRQERYPSTTPASISVSH